MDLLENPFYILAATPRDNRQKIVSLADERSLLLDSNECMKARSDLTNPRKRLSAEISWLPGTRPTRINELLTGLEHSILDLLRIDNMTSIARANSLAAGLLRLHNCTTDDVTEWILKLVWTFEDIDPENIRTVINEERIVSGFSEVTDISMIEEEVQERRRYFKQVIKSAVDKFPVKDRIKVITKAVESATDSGNEQGPVLIHDLVDSYEVDTQAVFNRAAKDIENLINEIKADADVTEPDSSVSLKINTLIDYVKKWDIIAQPIQVSKKSRGQDHDESQEIAGLVRGLAIHLFNKHGKLEFSQRLTKMLQEVFAEVVDIAERTAEDISTLSDIAEQRKHDESLNQIFKLCQSANDSSENDPSSADRDAQRVMDEAPQLLASLLSNKVPDEIILRGKEEIALTLMHCAIVYGNKTEKWKPCITFLNEALKYASSEELESRIKKNLSTVMNNDRIGSISQITSAPSLSTVNGIGFKLYGRSDFDHETSSYLSTYYFVFFFIPLFPIRRYRVIERNNVYKFLGKAPLRSFDKVHLFIFIGLLILFIYHIGAANNSGETYQSRASSLSDDNGASPARQSYDSESSRSYLATKIENGKAQASLMETKIKDMDLQLDDYEQKLRTYKTSDMVDDYNMLVPKYNSLVNERNDLYRKYENLIDEINTDVNIYNSRNNY